MELRKEFKQTEVGLVPSEWDVSPFSDLMTFQNGVNADKADYGKGTPFVNVLEVITKSHIHKKDVQGLVDLNRNQIDSFSVKKGDLLFNRTSETQEEVGLTSVYVDDEPIVFGGFVIRGRLIDKSKFNFEYSGYGLRAPSIRKQIISSGQGAVRANIGQADLKKVFAVVPPIKEQEAIANALADTDAYINSLEKIITKKFLIKKGVIRELLSGSKRLIGFEKEKGSKQSEVGLIPNDWTIEKLKDLALFSNGKAHENLITDNGSFVVVNSKFISTQGAVYKTASNNLSPLMQGEIVLVMSDIPKGKALAKCYFIERSSKYTLNQRICSLSATGVNPKYLFYYLNRNKYFLGFDNGVSQTNLKRDEVINCPVVLPPPSEQNAIAEIITSLEDEISILKAKLSKSHFLKNGMMQELLTGRIRLV